MSPFIARLILRLAAKNAKYLKQMTGNFRHRSNASNKISLIARNHLGIKPKGEIYMPPSQYKSAENIAVSKARKVLKRAKGKKITPTEADQVFLEGERARELWWLKRMIKDAGLE